MSAKMVQTFCSFDFDGIKLEKMLLFFLNKEKVNPPQRKMYQKSSFNFPLVFGFSSLVLHTNNEDIGLYCD